MSLLENARSFPLISLPAAEPRPRPACCDRPGRPRRPPRRRLLLRLAAHSPAPAPRPRALRPEPDLRGLFLLRLGSLQLRLSCGGNSWLLLRRRAAPEAPCAGPRSGAGEEVEVVLRPRSLLLLRAGEEGKVDSSRKGRIN